MIGNCITWIAEKIGLTVSVIVCLVIACILLSRFPGSALAIVRFIEVMAIPIFFVVAAASVALLIGKKWWP